jgi:hypothetical protein
MPGQTLVRASLSQLIARHLGVLAQASRQLPGIDFQPFRQPTQVQDGYVLPAPLDAADVRPVEPRPVGQLLLRYPETLPCGAHASTKVR